VDTAGWSDALSLQRGIMSEVSRVAVVYTRCETLEAGLTSQFRYPFHFGRYYFVPLRLVCTVENAFLMRWVPHALLSLPRPGVV
jgi:hypothetical protein